jgi:hypothetical protein
MPECWALVSGLLIPRLFTHPLHHFMFEIVEWAHFSGDHTTQKDVWLMHIRSPLIKPVSDGRMPTMRYVVFDGDTISFPEEDFAYET